MKWILKHKYYILSFIIPIILYTLIFYFSNIYFTRDYIPSDAQAQYIPTYNYLRNLLHNTSSFPYTFTKGFGGTMYAAYFYGISSPTNLLIYFFKNSDTFFILNILIKMGLTGLFSFYYFKKTTKYSNRRLFLFSILYAMSDYNIIYSANVMWLDGVMLLPLLLLSIENIVNNNKDKWYIIILLYLLVSNYYIGYMMTIFSIIYYCYYSYIKYNGDYWLKNNIKSIIRFIFLTFLIGCSITFILIPSAIESQNFIRVDSKFKIINFIFYDLISNTYNGMGNLINPLNYKNILIFFSVSMLPLLLNYYCNKYITKKEKKASVIVLLFFFIPVVIPFFNYLWHLFTYPQGFNYRYSFITTFFIIKLCLKSSNNINIDNRVIKKFYALYLIISIPLCFLSKNVPEYYIYLNIINIVITLVLLLLYFIFINKKMFYIIMIIDMILNISLITWQSKDFLGSASYPKYSYSYFSDKCKINYRCETTQNYDNNGLRDNYNNISSFISSSNGKTNTFLYKSLGTDEIRNYTFYDSQDNILDDLLSIKYISLSNNIRNIYYYDKIYTDKDMNFYENNDALSLGYLVDKDTKRYVSKKIGIKYILELVNTMFNTEYKLLYLDYSKDGNTYTINIPTNTYYIYIETDGKIKSNKYDELISKKDLYYIYYINNEKKISINLEKEPNNFKVYTLNFDEIKNFNRYTNELDITINDGNYIKGRIKGDKDKILFTSIPYDKGWKVYVDGIEIKHYELLNTFIGVDIPEGEHIVEFKYSTPGFKISLIISLISFTILVIYEIKRRK